MNAPAIEIGTTFVCSNGYNYRVESRSGGWGDYGWLYSCSSPDVDDDVHYLIEEDDILRFLGVAS